MFTELSKIAKVSLGYKSLQNNFFYLNKATIETFGVESKYLTPMLKLRDLDGHAYQQQSQCTLWLLNCKDTKSDLRGTGALRYIDAREHHPATEKKQTGKRLTIREALEAQAGGLWYAPKALPHRHHVWLRKAIDGVFSPFLFKKASLVDQRCNSLDPIAGVTWQELAAALTSSLFAYSLEINGSASMGAGALEAPTTKLRTYPVLDVTKLKKPAREKLVKLAETVWLSEPPVDWSSSISNPGPHLRDLDQWILNQTKSNTLLDSLYRDIRETCQSRKFVAADKTKKTKKKHTENIGTVADSIVKAISPKIKIKNFPEDFTNGAKLDIAFDIDRKSLKTVNVAQLLGSHYIQIIYTSGVTIYDATLPSSVAEGIVRALLWGRSQFSVSSDTKVMHKALSDFLVWLQEIEADIAKAISESALGTGYEDELKRTIYALLGIHALSTQTTLPHHINFVP